MSEALSSVTLELDKVAPFLIKLFEIVSSPASDALVCWSEYGETFRIVDRTKFAQVTAPSPSSWPSAISNMQSMDDDVEPAEVEQAPTHAPAAKKQRTDYSAFKIDVARLQKNLQDFEQDLREHTVQVAGP
ncbi:MAG: hypothetical protein SGPRY_001962 [Prymnesium sp.]